ncbi:PRC-barrel domain-containing protein [Roseibium sp. Sym1]|uniref:PRC-barrel domain-containing protein n=1 Tax=Roseibium sp. Sym1 TaxID=3016006 RepID=UPI0022B4AC96|nr:PRC-barrel domain-containing protein [Roseibium sp. Sym1]
MIRTLLTTTAVATMIATGALADSSSATKVETEAATAMPDGVYEFEFHTLSPDATSGILASNLIGKAVMNGDNDQAEAIGDINDVIITRDGGVRAVIVGVGGFLGIGEKDVALDMSRLSFMTKGDDRLEIVSDVSRDELDQANAFKRPDYIPDWMNAETVREEMDKISESARTTYEVVREEAIAPAKKGLDETVSSAWTAEKTRVNARTVSTEALIGAEVYTGKDRNIGEVSQVLIGEDGKAEAVVIDVGGFLGFGEKPVAVSFDSLKMFESGNGALIVTAPFSKEQLENAKTFEPAEYKESPESVILKG